MTGEEERKFNGFSPGTLTFLRGLKANNDKSWFQAHRADYEQHVLGPLRDLVTDLGDFMLDIDPRFEIMPAANKTISRIYRDTRFSKGKSPLSGELADDLMPGFGLIAPFYRYLQRIRLGDQGC